MNQGFYQYYPNNNAENNAFEFPSEERSNRTNNIISKSLHKSSQPLGKSDHNQIIQIKKTDSKPPNIKPFPKPPYHSKSTDVYSHTDTTHKPRLNDISSQESDNTMSTEFKKWSSQQKAVALRKAKSQTQDTLNSYDPPQYIPPSKATSIVSLNAASRHASTSYPYSNPNNTQTRQYYGNINNYIADHHNNIHIRNRHMHPPHHGHHGHHGQYNTHTRDRSQQSQQSLHSFASTTATTELSNNGVSSSSEDFILRNNDYASTTSPTQNPKMWNSVQHYSNRSNQSNSTNASIGSIKNINFMHRNSNIAAIFYEISRHFESCILYLENQIPRHYIAYMNQYMVKITLEFCGFDIEIQKFQVLYIQLEQLLKMHNITTRETNKINFFVYSGEELLKYLRACLDSLISYIQSPSNVVHVGDNLLTVLYSYYMKRGLSSMSIFTLNSLYQICNDYKLQQEKIQKMNDKLAVVKNLFNDEIKTPSNPPLKVNKSMTNITTDSSSKYKPPPQHSMAPQLSAPVNHHQLQPNPINHSKSHPELTSTHNNARNKAPDNNNKILEENKDTAEDDVLSDNGGGGGESTPVLSDLSDINNHLSPGVPQSQQNNDPYDSEMSATPQPTDIQKQFTQFMPNTIKALNSKIPPMPIQEIKEEPGPNIGDINYQKSGDADDEVSSPGSISTSTDNDTVDGNGNNRFKTIKTLTPTPHTHITKHKVNKISKINTIINKNNNIPQRSSQIIISNTHALRSNNNKTHSMTPIPARRRSNHKIGSIGNKTTVSGKRQSWADITMEKIDVYVHNDKSSEFKSFKPINQQQGVENMIAEYRKSLGQNELKGTLEVLQNEIKQYGGSNSTSDNSSTGNIVDVNQHSDSDNNDTEEDDDEFFDDDELQATQAKYMSMTGQVNTNAINPSKQQPNLDASIISSDSVSSRYNIDKLNKKQYKIIQENNNNNNNNTGSSNKIIPDDQSHGTQSHKSHQSHSRRSRSNKRGSSHGSHHSHHSKQSHSHRSHRSDSNHRSGSKKSVHSHNSHASDKSDHSHKKLKLNIETQYNLLSNSTTRSTKSNHKSHKSHRRNSDSESLHVRKFTNDTTQSASRHHHNNNTGKKSMHTYTYSNNTIQSHRPLDLKYGNSTHSNNSRHSRSSSDFIGINNNTNYKPPPKRPPNVNNQRYNYAFGVYDIEERESISISNTNSNDGNTSPISSNQIISPTSSSARKYQRKRPQTLPNDDVNKSIQQFQTNSVSSSNSSKKILKKHSQPRSPHTQSQSRGPPTPTRKRRVITAKHDQIRSNYIVRAQYVDQHKSFNKYSSDRNKSWKKWIKLLQSHDSDITNVSSPVSVQTLIDFARMSLGNYGNWLMMKSGNNPYSNSPSQFSINSSKSNQWTRYFAVMRDFNLFLFRNEYIPQTLNDVVNQDYLALSVAHIENVKQCNKNQSELYLEVTGSKTNHKLKFRCDDIESCQQWVAEMNYQIHIVSDLCCNKYLRLECADQKRSIWIPVAPLTPLNPYSKIKN